MTEENCNCNGSGNVDGGESHTHTHMRMREKVVRVVCISDTHGAHDKISLPGALPKCQVAAHSVAAHSACTLQMAIF